MNLAPLLDVTRRLAEPFDLDEMLEEVVKAAVVVLSAERASVWLYEPSTHELVLDVSADLRQVRVPADAGIVGTCARERQLINVPDCYADLRFNRELDLQSNFRTRCMLSLPLVDHRDALVGVLQVLNKSGGVFERDDEALASALAAQCAVALQRARMTAELIETEKMRRELEVARQVQLGSLPAIMPDIPGYEVFGVSRPADQTGGDTFDAAMLGPQALLVLGDATGHGLGPALHVTQMHAMLRMALRLGTSLDDTVFHLNNQLAAELPDDRFITAFIGLLDTQAHQLRFHSAGQGPILHLRAATGLWDRRRPTTFPLAAMGATAARPGATLAMAPGDLLALLSDGVFEHPDAGSLPFGEQRVCQVLEAEPFKRLPDLTHQLLAEVRRHAAGTAQPDDITVLLLRRCWPRVSQAFARRIDELPEVFAFIDRAFHAFDISLALRHDVHFVVEELFTNAVKYGGASSQRIELELQGAGTAAQVRMTDRDVHAFDPTRVPDADVNQPIEHRKPGGLGLHLVRRIVDGIDYRYDEATRTGHTRFHRRLASPAG